MALKYEFKLIINIIVEKIDCITFYYCCLNLKNNLKKWKRRFNQEIEIQKFERNNQPIKFLNSKKVKESLIRRWTPRSSLWTIALLLWLDFGLQ